MNDSITKTLAVAFTICLVCSLVVSYTAVGLRDLQNENKLNDERKKILQSANMYDADLTIASQFEKLEMRYVDFTTGKIIDSYNNFSMNTFEKNKVLPIMLEYNEFNKKKEWPSSINMCCFWCSEQFDSVPVGIPIMKQSDTYYMYGNFCSPECAAAYIFDNKKFINDCWERYSMLNYIYGNNESIKVAPSKLCLKKYGGRLSIKEYRHICTKFNKSYKLLLPPMISILPMIEEINLNDDSNNIDMYLLNKEQINKANEEYRLKRNKPLPDSKNTLESCMQLKVL